MTAPNRRWFAYSLRTLFVVVTVICVGLGYELNWIRQRREFIGQEKARTAELLLNQWRYEPRLAKAVSLAQRPSQAPGLLWVFGERGHSMVTFIVEAEHEPRYMAGWARTPLTSQSYARLQQAERLFPEAEISLMLVDEIVGEKHFPPRLTSPKGAAWAAGIRDQLPATH